MATLISNASALLTGATTFAAVETDTGALALVRNNTFSLAGTNAQTSSSSTFTITNAKVIDGVLLWIKNTTATPAGTLLIELQKGGVTQASVSVNKADLPASSNANPSPVFFKFTSTATGDGGANWTVKVTSGGGVTSAFILNIDSATTSDWTRALRTTTAATAAAADDFYVIGELTGAGTSNALTVTMDQTAATIYGSGVLNTTSAAGGGIHIGKQGTLTFDTTVNSLLYVNGDVNVWDGGTYNQGTSGTPVPITKTATLKFKQNTLDGDFGLIGNDGGTINAYGVPRTAGKLVVQCKLNADFSSTNLVASSSVITPTNGTTTNPITNAVGVYSCFGAIAFTDNATTGGHGLSFISLGSVTNTTQTARFFAERGSGTNNRFLRCQLANTNSIAPSQGFYADVDLQAGTIGATGTFGTGSVASSSIAAQDGGYLVTITGIVSTGAAAPIASMWAASALGTVSYSGNTTQNFVYRLPEVYTSVSIPAQTSLTVDTDTGWLAGDLIALASTTRTIQDCEPAVLTSNAGASSLATTLNVLYAHSGTSPTQAEVINLTRNVKICSDSAALMTYCQFGALCTVNMQWTEVFYAGANAAAKAALTAASGATTSPKSITFCSVHDAKGGAFVSTGVLASSNTVFSNNTIWNSAVTLGPGIATGTFVLTDWTMDSNTLIRTYNGNAWTLSDVGGTFTNNTAVGAASIGFSYSEGNTIGTHTGNTAHSNGGVGLQIGVLGVNGTIATLKDYRNNSIGFNISTAGCDIVLDTPTLFGNLPQNITLNAGSSLRIISPTSAGDSTFSTTTGIAIGSALAVNLRVENGSFGVASGILTAHTQDISIGAGPTDLRAILLNTVLGSATEIATPQNLAYSGYISSEKADQTAGNHFTVSRNGKVQTDSVIFHTASPSMRMTPASALTIGATITNGSGVVSVTSFVNGLNWASLYVGQLVSVSAGFAATLQAISSFSQSAGTITFGNNATGATGTAVTLTPFLKLESAPKNHGMLVPHDSGATRSISVWIRTSVVGDGQAYNGAAPRLIQRANAALGLNADVGLQTFGGSAGAWTQVTGVSTAPTGDAGAFEFVADCDGAQGWINVDDWAYA